MNKPQRAAPLTAPLIYADRLFPADFATRAVARRLYAEVRDLADHLAARAHRPALVRRGCAVPRSGTSVRHAGPLHFPHALQPGRDARGDGHPAPGWRCVETDARKIWRKFAEHYHLFRGTPTRLWLDQAFADLFGMTVRLSAGTADHYFDRISECLAQPEFRPRALFERFKIEVIATTESPLDPLAHHKAIAESGWKGRVITAYRPDPVVDPEFDGFKSQCRNVRQPHALRHVFLARLSRGAPAAPRLFQAARRDLDRPRAHLGADRRSAADRCGAAVRQDPVGRIHRRRCRTVPRADADRNGAHEPGRRTGDANPSRIAAQP